MNSGLSLVRESFGRIPMLGSSEYARRDDEQEYDEKHYFIIPYRFSDSGYMLYSMRCLPEGAPHINDFPKRRIFHLPQENITALVDELLKDQAQKGVEEEGVEKTATVQHLEDLADRIDQVDDKLFGGVLLIGGAIAFFNPVVGATIAISSLVPSVALMLSKLGIQVAGDRLNTKAIQARVEKAKKQLVKEF
ncbi:MAG: hypothetical protein AAF492_00355, partial [Verrucomicrobiota bacterium]